MSRPLSRPGPPRPRGAFDLLPRSQTMAASQAGSLYNPNPISNGAAPGYALGGAASAAASRLDQQRENDLKIEDHKEKERQKNLKKLEEKIKRYSHLNTAPGQNLNDAPGSSLGTVRQLQDQMNNEAIESHKMKESEHETQEKLAQKNMMKLQEKIKRYPYLNTVPGQRMNLDAVATQDQMIGTAIEEHQMLHAAQQDLNKLSPSKPAKTMEPLDKDKAMREMRRRLQENYDLSVRDYSQAPSSTE